MISLWSESSLRNTMASNSKSSQTPVVSAADSHDIIRPELNIEKFPSIWQPARARQKLNKIVVERPLPNGLIAKVTVLANSEYGPLTTETQKVLYALYKISESQGYQRRVTFSLSRIAKILNKTWGESTMKLINKALHQLRFTGLILEDSFYDATRKATITPHDTLTILSSLKMINEKRDGHTTTEACYCEFNEYIFNNLINNYVKPLFLDMVLSLGDDGITQIFYTHLDLILTEDKPYRRRSKKLFEEFNLKSNEYERINYRKKTLEKVKAKLDGKGLSRGGVLKLTIEKTADDSDYNLVAERVQPNQSGDESQETNSKLDQSPLVSPESTASPVTDGTENPASQASELVEYFSKKFHNLNKIEPQPGDIKRATKLIEKYGMTAALYVVDYAFHSAQKTNFKIANLGGVMQYAARAVAKLKREQASAPKFPEMESQFDSNQLCDLCRTTFGQVFWVKIGDDPSVVGQMNCLHDESAHRRMEREQKIKIGFSPADFQSPRSN